MRCLLLIVLVTSATNVLAHGGGLNAEGCHTNRKTGDYHCYRAPPVRAPLPAVAAASAPEATPIAKTPPVGPKCYVGPRGGTYTITPSGKKNYGGC